MRRLLARSIPIAILGAFGAAVAAYALTSVTVYTNDLATAAHRKDIVQISGRNCTVGGASAFRVRVGKRTSECAYRTPVVGRNLIMVATARLLSSTPGSIAPRTFVALSLRDGGAGQYQLQIFPRKRSWKLVRDRSPHGQRTTLGFGMSAAIKGPDKGNKMRLQAIDTGATCRIVALVNGNQLAAANDPSPGQLNGSLSVFSVGSDVGAVPGATGSFNNLQVSVPG